MSEAPKLLTFEQVSDALQIGPRPTPRAAKMALRRLIARANDTRRDRRLPPIRPVRIGRVEFYRETFVSELLANL